jgi:formylglycine-generating enzyme required for sulfatase activity
MKFCWCPPGSFRMGSPPTEPERGNDEGPVQVTLSRGFWMGKFEVTQAQWQQVMGTTLRQQNEKSTIKRINGEGPEHPIYQVSAVEADEFCRKFTASERAAGRLPAGWEYRLPTEAQWEYPCRAGTATATAFGDRLGSDEANFDGSYPYNGAAKGPYLKETAPVGRYRANTWGLHDMHGNVWEWCADGFEARLAGGVDPVGPSAAASRVIRGGGWGNAGGGCRSAFRIGFAPGDRISNLGFRVARVPSSSR